MIGAEVAVWWCLARAAVPLYPIVAGTTDQHIAAEPAPDFHGQASRDEPVVAARQEELVHAGQDRVVLTGRAVTAGAREVDGHRAGLIPIIDSVGLARRR